MGWDVSYMEVVFTLGVCFLLWLIGSFFIARKAKGARAIRRVFFLFITVIGIVLIVVKPAYRYSVDPEIVHIVSSYEAVDIPLDHRSFESVHDFLSSDVVDKTAEVHVYGIGLEREELELLESQRIIFHPAETISGITVLRIPQITEREEWTLSGSYQGANVERIYLRTPDQRDQGTRMVDGNFEITSTAPVAGSYLMELHTILSTKDTLKEILPIDVLHEPTWQMLLLSSYPSFENKYLKNYWTGLGNGFASRSKISKEKYHTSFTNSKKRNIDVLTRNVVSRYDFIIADGLSWNQLSAGEQSNIKSAVWNNGLALIIRPSKNNATLNNLQAPRWNLPKEIKWKTQGDDVVLARYDLSSSWRSSIAQGHEVAKYAASGLGHLAVLGIDETYRLILADKETNYQDLWSGIFSDLYRDFSPTSKLMHDQWIWEGEKSKITILSNKEVDTPPILNDSMSLPYVGVPLLKGVAEVLLWPQEGYNSVSLRDGVTELKLYAHEKDSWRAVKQNHLLAINKQAAASSTKMTMAALFEARPISMFWWYGLCLLGLGLLWLDERLYG